LVRRQRRLPGDNRYLAWLSARSNRCAFPIAPDQVGDATATLTRFLPMLHRIRALGYRRPWSPGRHDGLEHQAVPRNALEVMFLGGSTGWKLDPAAADDRAGAPAPQDRPHGRVNSLRRLIYAAAIGCRSVDGTHLAYGPERKLPGLLRWLTAVNQPVNYQPIHRQGVPRHG
jgi:hypothetical protein